jgi:hypothetical protein
MHDVDSFRKSKIVEKSDKSKSKHSIRESLKAVDRTASPSPIFSESI